MPSGGVADRFGLLLVGVVVTVTFTMAAPAGRWAFVVALVLQAGVLVLALRVALASRRLLRAGVAAAAVIVGAGLVAETSGVGAGGRLVPVLGVLLVVAAMTAIVVRLGRRGPGVDGRTVLGAVCVYLLLGTLFTFAFGAVGAADGFFEGDEPTNLASLQYFSLVTLTTVGYGDLVPATRVGRSLAVVEALLGQVYLVTVVAVLVGRLGSLGRAIRGDDPTA